MRRKVAIVTGGASGMGREIALAFARDGVDVLIADIDEVGGARTEATARELHAGAVFNRTDVGDGGSVTQMVERAVAEFGAVDYAVNAAGIGSETVVLHECDDDDFDRLMAVNLRSVFLCLRAELTQLVEQGTGGAIVNIASINASKAFPRKALYGATKAGVVAMTANAAIDYAPQGIRINAICPGRIDTPMLRATMSRPGRDIDKLALDQPIGRLGYASEIADAALWLCSDKSSFVVGEALRVDGGYLAG